MSMQLRYNGFIINKINYEYKNELESEQQNYYLDFNFDDITVATSDDDAIITLSGYADCSNDEKEDETSKYRSLNLNVSYFYKIENSDNDSKKVQKLTEDYGVNNSIVMFQELVKQITGLDSTSPIVSYDFKFPGSIK